MRRQGKQRTSSDGRGRNARRRRNGRPRRNRRPRRNGRPRRNRRPRRNGRGPSEKEPAVQSVVQSAEAPENRDRVQDDVEECFDSTALQARVREHELESMRPVEEGSADQDEEEQSDEWALPQRREGSVRPDVPWPEAERRREEQQEQRDREQKRGDEPAQGEQAPEDRFEDNLRLAGLRIRVD